MEAAGIATVGVSLCEEITSKVRPPRTLYVPFAFGYPLGEANDAALQTRIVVEALSLLEAAGPPPVSREFTGSAGVSPASCE